MHVMMQVNACENIRRGKHIMHPTKMMVELEQNLLPSHKE
jgi:hypothetical protein